NSLNDDAKHAGAFYAKNMEIQPAAKVDFHPPSALECVPRQLTIPLQKECSSTSLPVPTHRGVTRAIWEGEEEVQTGKRVEPVEEFAFTFTEPVSLENFAETVRIVSVGCNSTRLGPGCEHD